MDRADRVHRDSRRRKTIRGIGRINNRTRRNNVTATAAVRSFNSRIVGGTGKTVESWIMFAWNAKDDDVICYVKRTVHNATLRDGALRGRGTNLLYANQCFL